MSETWMEAIDARSASALADGTLQPVQSEEMEVSDGGMRFVLRWVSSLAAKDAVKKEVAIPGGPRDPAFNPFLNPDPALTVGAVGPAHVAILNKFPLCAHHLVLARREFEEQLTPLARIDFEALATIMCEAGGLGVYNGGAAAGASQRHKHVQWIPDAPGNASLKLYLPGLPAEATLLQVALHRADDEALFCPRGLRQRRGGKHVCCEHACRFRARAKGTRPGARGGWFAASVQPAGE